MKCSFRLRGFVSVNEHFDSIDGITNQNRPSGSSIRVPIINAFNEQTSVDIKKKVEEALDMKAKQRVVPGAHEALADADIFDGIQKSFQTRAFNLAPKNQMTENILKGKIICGCCGGKMQRRRGTNHAGWYFFTCITDNRLGAGRCTGMYVREEDAFKAVYHQLKLCLKEHFISTVQYRQEMEEHDNRITYASQEHQLAYENGMRYYEKFVNGEIDRTELRTALDYANELKVALEGVVAQKTTYEKQYQVFRKLLRVSDKELTLSETMNCIDRITVDIGKQIIVKWHIS